MIGLKDPSAIRTVALEVAVWARLRFQILEQGLIQFLLQVLTADGFRLRNGHLDRYYLLLGVGKDTLLGPVADELLDVLGESIFRKVMRV